MEREQKANEETIEAALKKNILNIVYTVKPIYIIHKWFGISMFDIKNGEIRPTNWKMKMLGSSGVLAIIVLFFLSFTIQRNVETSTFHLLFSFVIGLIYLTQYVTLAITTFLGNTDKIKYLAAFAELDILLRVETINGFYKKSRSETVKYLIGLFITHVINTTLYFIEVDYIHIPAIVLIPLDFFQKFQIFVFCRLVLMLRTRLMLINDYVTTFIENRNSKNVNIFTIWERKVKTEANFNFIGRPSENNTKIRDLATLYDLMGKICEMINDGWNFKIFMSLVTAFTFSVMTMWTSLYFYKGHGDCLPFLINVIIWCFSAIYTIAIMSFICERLLQVRNDTKVIVNKVIMDYNLPKTMRVQAKAFIELIEAWPLRFYVYDMFSVDITLMLKFISVATTYLIVIIQISHFF